jgi:TonB family protein
MSEAVTDVIVSRAQQADGLKTMLVWSVAIHALAVAGALLMPQREVDEAPTTVMTISLGGVPGPKTDGMNQMGGRSVQAVAPDVKPVETPPAPERPKMTLPDPRSKPRVVERPKPTQAPAESTSRTLSTGAETREGTTRTETQVRGQGFGLAQGGGFGGWLEFDVANFCCPEYLGQVRDLIQRNYNPKQEFVGMTKMMFTIQRSGLLTDIKTERPSGYAVLDLASLRALQATQKVPPLPTQYTNPSLTVHLIFEYRR